MKRAMFLDGKTSPPHLKGLSRVVVYGEEENIQTLCVRDLAAVCVGHVRTRPCLGDRDTRCRRSYRNSDPLTRPICERKTPLWCCCTEKRGVGRTSFRRGSTRGTRGDGREREREIDPGKTAGEHQQRDRPGMAAAENATLSESTSRAVISRLPADGRLWGLESFSVSALAACRSVPAARRAKELLLLLL